MQNDKNISTKIFLTKREKTDVKGTSLTERYKSSPLISTETATAKSARLPIKVRPDIDGWSINKPFFLCRTDDGDCFRHFIGYVVCQYAGVEPTDPFEK